MKEELQGKLVEILTSIQSAAGKASDFAMEQLPDIAQSYVVYGRVSSSFAVAVFLAVCIAAIFVALRFGFFGRGVDQFGHWSSGRLISAIFGAFGVLIGFIGVATNAPAFFLVWFAPKVWLLKEIAGLLK